MKLKIFSGESNPRLTSRIVDSLNVLSNPPTPAFSLGDVYHHTFPTGEFHCQYKENIRGCDVFLVQSMNSPVNNNLMQLLVMADAARRASAERITAIIPYMGYARSDRKVQSRTPIAAKLVIDMIESAGIDRIVTMDLHSGQVQGFTNLPFDNLYAFPLIIEYVKKNGGTENLVIVSPDLGGTKRASALADILKCGFACVIKKREGDSDVSNKGIVGDVSGKDVLLVDDMTESLGTLLEAAKTCREAGAKVINAFVTHNLLNDVGIERLGNDTIISSLITTNTVNNLILGLPIVTLRSETLFAKAIYSIHNNESISELFSIKGF